MSENDVAIPGFQSMMLPVLQILGDGKAWLRKDIIAELAEQINLTQEQQKLRYKNGSSVLSGMFSWVWINLRKAGLMESIETGYYKITKAGQTLLQQNPDAINCRFLKENYPAYAQWLQERRKPRNGSGNPAPEVLSEIIDVAPPEEILEKTHSILCADLASDLLDQVKKKHWTFFERLVLDLLTKMGYGGSRQDAAKVVGKSGDNGIDGVIKEDKLGFDVVYVQAKRYLEPVTISQVRDFAGALLYKKARKGVFITTSSFPKSAEDFVATIEQKIILIDGQRLAELMIEYNVGVAIKETYEVKRIDYDYFDESEL